MLPLLYPPGSRSTCLGIMTALNFSPSATIAQVKAEDYKPYITPERIMSPSMSTFESLMWCSDPVTVLPSKSAVRGIASSSTIFLNLHPNNHHRPRPPHHEHHSHSTMSTCLSPSQLLYCVVSACHTTQSDLTQRRTPEQHHTISPALSARFIDTSPTSTRSTALSH
jgi:hypothetical protein